MLELTFGEQVKIILSRKGMTIKELAEKIEKQTGKKMSRQNLTQRLGRDNFQEQDMRMIAKILDCPFYLDILEEHEEHEEKLSKAQKITEPEKKKTPAKAEERDITIGELVDIHKELDAIEKKKSKKKAKKVVEENPEYVQETIFDFFVNEKAAELGCTNTVFTNPTGLPDENHYTTASDMAKIAKSAWLNPLFRRYCTKRYYEIPPTNKFAEARQLLNHHKMMKNGEYYYEGVRGGKTGYTDASGNTLVTYCKRGNITLVAVILNSTSAANAYSDTTSLFNYGFENFEKVDMKVSMEPVPFKVLPCDKYILKNNGNTYPFYYQTKVYVTLPKGIKKSQLNKRQAVLQNAVGPLRLKSKYYYKKQMVGWGMQYERNIVSDLLLAS